VKHAHGLIGLSNAGLAAVCVAFDDHVSADTRDRLAGPILEDPGDMLVYVLFRAVLERLAGLGAAVGLVVLCDFPKGNRAQLAFTFGGGRVAALGHLPQLGPGDLAGLLRGELAVPSNRDASGLPVYARLHDVAHDASVRDPQTEAGEGIIPAQLVAF